ncbi:MAG: SH3 domain-containing protein [Synergistaceae bacterium]|jgi:uncharacterized protein YecT (DUF1311 family)|nr:SH3 domain-containing protein [Synergistaceae bacterium]
MKNFLLSLAAVLALFVISVQDAWALSDADYKKFMQACPEFAEADARLNKAWKALSGAASEERMGVYRDEQKKWVGTLRDSAVGAMMAGGAEDIPDAVKRDGKVDRALAYAFVTEERAGQLEEMAKQELGESGMTVAAEQQPAAADDVQAFGSPVPAEVVSEKAFVRAGHDNKAKRVATLEEGDALDLLAQWDGGDAFSWYRVETDSGEGWIYGQNVQRLDGGSAESAGKTAASANQAPDKAAMPNAGVLGSDGDYVTVMALGQGTDRAKALEQAWIEAVRLAVGAIISSKSELTNDDFAENTIAHSRGVVESFDIVSEESDGKRVTVAIQAKVRKEILADAAKTWSEAQTMKADAAGAVKAQLDVKAKDSTAQAKQSSGVELLKEVLDAYGPEMFYSATLDPKVRFDEKTKKPYLQVIQKFNEDLFWKEFLPRLRSALDGVAVKKEKKFYVKTVQSANQRLAKEKLLVGAGLYFFRDIQINNDKWDISRLPYSWIKDGEELGQYPSGGFLKKTRNTDSNNPIVIVVPDNTSSYTVYYTNATCSGYILSLEEFLERYEPEEHIMAPFIRFLQKMDARIMWSVSYFDKQGNEMGSQAIDAGRKAILTYRSYAVNMVSAEVGHLLQYINEGYMYFIGEAIGIAPGFLSSDRINIYLDTTKVGGGFWVELDESDLPNLDSMKFEYVFENQ